jgi:uncharacterized protein
MRNCVVPFLFFIVLCSCKGEKKYHDTAKTVVVVKEATKMASILKFQQELNAEFKNPDSSPLPDRYRKDFEALDFFPADTSYVVVARLERTPEALPFLMPTNTERTSEEVVYGIAHFQLNGKDFRLEVYQNPELMQQQKYEDYLFLPFTDLTNGNETYGGGRYLDLEIPEGDTLVIDFNKAYNPYCVYNKKFSCPLVPKVNHLNTRVLAGVKDFK